MQFSEYWNYAPKADPAAVVQGEHYRITVLTDRLVRVEYSETDSFCDSATMMAIRRDLPVPEYSVYRQDGKLIVETSGYRVKYDEKPFTPEGMSVELNGQFGAYTSAWHYGEKLDTLKGTARTLDGADGTRLVMTGGTLELEDGLISQLNGYSAIDDSASMRVDANGELSPSPNDETDIYVFCYGHDYYGCYRDFMRLSGRTPALPRYALGNWWSRFYPYTEETYKQVIERFEAEQVPLSVSVIDMNWHTTDIDPKYGTGWTGYTWDDKCFPEPKRMLDWLHAHGMRVTLNDHPADGLRAYEQLYEKMALEMGMDPKEGKAIPFDAASRKYREAFEKIVLDAFDETGVDFWWLDWQQQGGTSVKGIDPLYMLNHSRFLYMLKKDRQAMTFSRYAGPGSHRYPIGFSGDTIVSWESLDLQPYFTATAANIGYCWWSHDIGGHMMGIRDDELAVRWLQFGALSPILRLHSSPSDFSRKEPWSYGDRACGIMKEYLRLRHRLLPWLYTCNVRSSEEMTPFIRPVYYDHPDDWATYYRKNEYLLGDGLLVCPVTQAAEPDTGLAAVRVWLPDGMWTDMITGRRYKGVRTLNMYRPMEQIPVLAKAGQILPMDGAEVVKNGGALPEQLTVRFFAGADGETKLIEDNGVLTGSEAYVRAETAMRMSCADGLKITIDPVKTEGTPVPASRRYTAEVWGIGNVMPDSASCGYTAAYDAEKRVLTLTLDASVKDGVTLEWNKVPQCPAYPAIGVMTRMLNLMRMKHNTKERVVRILSTRPDPVDALTELHVVNIPKEVYGLAAELLSVK